MKALLVFSALLIACPSRAEWKPEYASNPPEVQQWYRNAELTPEAQKRFPYKKCCDHADVVKTQFRIDRSGAHDEWWWLDGENWRKVPEDIIHWGDSAPGGKPTLFVFQGKETCFFPGDSGI